MKIQNLGIHTLIISTLTREYRVNSLAIDYDLCIREAEKNNGKNISYS